LEEVLRLNVDGGEEREMLKMMSHMKGKREGMGRLGVRS